MSGECALCSKPPGRHLNENDWRKNLRELITVGQFVSRVKPFRNLEPYKEAANILIEMFGRREPANELSFDWFCDNQPRDRRAAELGYAVLAGALDDMDYPELAVKDYSNLASLDQKHLPMFEGCVQDVMEAGVDKFYTEQLTQSTSPDGPIYDINKRVIEFRAQWRDGDLVGCERTLAKISATAYVMWRDYVENVGDYAEVASRAGFDAPDWLRDLVEPCLEDLMDNEVAWLYRNGLSPIDIGAAVASVKLDKGDGQTRVVEGWQDTSLSPDKTMPPIPVTQDYVGPEVTERDKEYEFC